MHAELARLDRLWKWNWFRHYRFTWKLFQEEQNENELKVSNWRLFCEPWP